MYESVLTHYKYGAETKNQKFIHNFAVLTQKCMSNHFLMGLA